MRYIKKKEARIKFAS